MRAFLFRNGFLFGLLSVVGLAAWIPEFGGSSEASIATIRRIGVCLIFFNQGVLLPGEALRRGLVEWRLHGVTQLSTYVLFPLVTLVGLWILSPVLSQVELRTGFLYLAFLPTTISSAVVLTSAAEGNVSGALFNCTFSSVIGVFLTPLLCVGVLGTGGGTELGALGEILGSVAVTILLPLAVGQGLRPFVGAVFTARKGWVRTFNNGVILFIVWAAFRRSFVEEVWSRVSTADMMFTILGVTWIWIGVSGVIWWSSGRIRMERASRIAALYCGGQKTLAVGLPLAAVIFGEAHAALSLILIPLLMYHPLQLVLGGWLAPRLRSGHRRVRGI